MSEDPGWGGFTPMPGAQPPATAPAPPSPAPQPAAPPQAAAADVAPSASHPPAAAPARPSLDLGSLLRSKGALGSATWLKRPAVRIAIAIVGIAAIASGVQQLRGSGGTSKDAFIKKADELCSAARPQLQNAYQQQNVQGALQIQNSLLTQIRALDQPSKDKSTLEQIYALFEADSQAVLQGDYQNAQVIENQIPNLARTYGFSVCGMG